MLIRQFRYPAGMVEVVSLAPREPYTFDGKGSVNCVGTIYASGVIAPVGTTDWDTIEKHRDYRPKKQWGGWTSKAKAKGEATFAAGPEGALWTCLSHFKEVDHRPLAGSLVIPAGWGFVVGAGDVILGDPMGKVLPPPAQIVTREFNRADDAGKLQMLLYLNAVELGPVDGAAQAGEIGNYFGALDEDSEVTGNGDLLLVR